MLEKITFKQKINKDYEGSFEIRDLREKDRFVVDDKFLNGYARFLGVYAVGVYNSLCRHANKEQRCWPSIKKIAQELSIGRNKVFDSVKYLEFWQIIKKERLGKKLTNRYLLLSKRYWKPISESSLKDFSEVYHINFKSLLDKLQEFITSTSIVRKHNSKLTQKKGGLSFKELADAYKKGERKYKPLFLGDEMRWSQNRWWVIKNGEWFEFAGKEAEIEWR